VAVLEPALAGCGRAARPARVDPREIRGRPVSDSIEVPLEVGGDRVAVAWLACGGAFTTRLGPSRQVLHVRLRVRNLDAAPMRVPLDLLTLEALGTEARIKPFALVGHDANRASVEIAPGAVREIDLVFPVASLDLDHLKGFKLLWGIDVSGGIVRNETYFGAAPDPRLRGRVARAFRPFAI